MEGIDDFHLQRLISFKNSFIPPKREGYGCAAFELCEGFLKSKK
jgi:hypothetical protein